MESFSDRRSEEIPGSGDPVSECRKHAPGSRSGEVPVDLIQQLLSKFPPESRRKQIEEEADEGVHQRPVTRPSLSSANAAAPRSL